MRLHLAFISTILSTAAGLKASSAIGSKLLSQARRVEQGEDYSWIVDYSLKFESCHAITQLASGDGNNDGENDNNLWTQSLVRFKLCPSSSCSSTCSGAEYLVDMAQFVDSYTENRLDAEEYACEMIRENCDCENANDDEVCEKQCYVDAGLEYCIEEEADDDQEVEEFNLQEYLECRELELNQNNNNNNNNNNNQYFVGPKCSADGKSINLAIFTDEMCTFEASSAAYSKYSYAYKKTLPYSETSIVENNCVTCVKEDDNNNNNNNNNNKELSEMCAEMYEGSAKCERSLSIYSPNTGGCDYMDTIYRREDNYVGSKTTASTAFAWIFFISTLGLAGYLFTLIKKEKATINLNDDGIMA